MKRFLKDSINRLLGYYNIGLARRDYLESLMSRNALDIDFLLAMPREYSPILLDNIRHSKAQLRQDLFVLSKLDFKRNGFFVEFGATDGLSLSNTFLLENAFQWAGILAEPAHCWHQAIEANRPNAIIEKRCVWSHTGECLQFNEATVAELSTINHFSQGYLHAENRKGSKTYSVETISLNDLLDNYNAPKEIDYLSIDTEGSELAILNNFDFNRRIFRVITCEHNYTPARQKIYALLTQKGYQRVHESLSQFDDWYVKT